MQWFSTASTAAGKRTGLCRKSRPLSGRRTRTGRTGSITGIASSTATPTAAATCAARPRELLRRVSAGLTITRIARYGGISDGAVHTHLYDIYERLHVSSRTAAVTRAFPDRVG